ncbi:unnamed protein product [Bemisia tabaci]|uniref:SYO1-like TPR repeats domain-containing protein n=1 Tax=Bemisia tabaci TaxID=7038 RepID=A0A9P0AJX7_BEMTA|nr:unnamed protein product [Bemisia tabaci]
MGKHKNRNRFKAPRHAAISRRVAELGYESTETTPTNFKTVIENVESKLQLPSSSDKICGLQILSNVLDEPGILKEIIETKITKLIAPCLVDSHPSLRNVAAATLRILSDHGDICDALIEQDIMTPVVAFIHKFAEDVKPEKKDQKVSENSDTFNHVINLLWNLCESSSVAVKYFNSEKLLAILTRFLNPNDYRPELVISVAQCLLTASEENQNALNILENEVGVIKGLINIKSEEPASILLRTLAAGLMYNIVLKEKSGSQTELVVHILSLLSTTLVTDVRSLVHELTSEIPVEGNSSSEECTKINSVENILDAQLVAIEVLTNIFTCEDEESMEEDGEDSFSDSDVSEAGEIFTPCVSFPTIVQEAVSSVELVPRLLSKLEPPAENVCGILSSNKDSQRLLVKFKLLQTRSLFCFHNLVSGLDVQCLGGADKLFELWTSISQEVLKSFEVQGEEFLEAASSAMRAIILKLAAEKYSSSIKLDQSDLEILFSATKKCPYDSIRAILIRNIGTFGTFFINSEQESVLDAVGTFLLEMCNSSKEVWIIAEAVDALMDLYAEDETDASAARINLVQRLQIGAPVLKTMIRSQKGKLGDHLPLVSTVQSNLGRFIKYKGKRINKLNGC